MIRLYGIALVIAGFFWLKAIAKLDGKARQQYMRKSGMLFLAAILLLLALTGRLQPVFAGLSVVIAFVWRFMPVVMRYLPQLLSFFNSNKGYASTADTNTKRPDTMTAEQAYKILGVSVSASREDIIMAHQKLMLKNHPDKGGSSYLAAQINQAKDYLLK